MKQIIDEEMSITNSVHKSNNPAMPIAFIQCMYRLSINDSLKYKMIVIVIILPGKIYIVNYKAIKKKIFFSSMLNLESWLVLAQ